MSFRIGYGQVEANQIAAQKTGRIFASLPLVDEVSVLQNGEFMFYDAATGYVTAGPKVDTQDVVMTEPYMVWNEVKIYEDYLSLKDFAMIRVGDNYVTNPAAIGRVTSANTDDTVYGDGALNVSESPVGADGHIAYGYRMNGIAPRLMGTEIGDIWTTNMLAETTNGGKAIVAGTPDSNSVAFNSVTAYAQGQKLGLHKTDRNTLELCNATDYAAKLISNIRYVVVKVYTMPDGQPGVKIQRIQ